MFSQRPRKYPEIPVKFSPKILGKILKLLGKLADFPIEFSDILKTLLNMPIDS